MYQFPDRHTDEVVIHASLDADNTPAAIDLTGYQAAQVIIAVGVGGVTFSGTDKIEFKLRAGDATVGGHAAVAAGEVVMPSGQTLGSNGIIRSLIAAHAAPTVYTYDVTLQDPAKSHISILADFSGTHGTATPICVIVRKLRHRLNPPA